MLTPICYTIEENNLIKSKLTEQSFNHNSWADDDFLPIKESIKKHYHKIQNGVCPYCKLQLNSFHGRNWDIEHIIPRSHGPNFMFEPLNLCMSCVGCNSEKSNKVVTDSKAKVTYPIKPSQYRIIHPHFDNYEEHLLVIEAGLFYYPLKPKGRKTVEVCGLTRFYEFAGFGSNAEVFIKIQSLAAAAEAVDSENIKEDILAQISVIALRGVIQNKREDN